MALQSSKKDLTNIRNRTILRWSDFGQLGGTDMNRVFDQTLMAYNKEMKKLDDTYRSASTASRRRRLPPCARCPRTTARPFFA